MFKHISRLILLGLLLSLVTIPVGAQETAWAKLSPPNTDSFPRISTYLNVYDGEGNFVHDLGAHNVNIIENQRSIPVSEITALHAGSQFVVALNMDPTYAIKDSQGATRYEHIQGAMSAWIDAYPPGATDDLSFVTNDDIEGLHFNRPVAWLSKFRSYQPNVDTAIPSLDVLGRAITTATDPTTQSDLGRGILLITPLPNQDSLAVLPSLESMALQGNVRVYIWMVASRAYFDSVGADLLAAFAARTGGQLFLYSGDETLPAVDTYIDQLRHTYILTYDSQISGGGEHQISAHINTPSLEVASEPVGFALNVQPPNPIFVSPPLDVIRTEQTSPEEPSTEIAEYTPNKQHIEILIEFPDNFSRSLKRTTLFVDGEIAAENTSPPFDEFTWFLEDFVNDGSHLIQVEAVDDLGLSGTSIEHQVNIAIQRAPFNFLNLFRQNIPILIGISAAIVVSIFVVALIIGGKIQPKTTGRLIWRRRPQGTEEPKPNKSETAPAVQLLPQKPQPTRKRLSLWTNRFAWPAKREESPVEEAYLEFITAKNGNVHKERIPIIQSELTFGNDPTLATIELLDPSLDALHARLRKDEHGSFIISDEGSVAGTWVNYMPVPSAGIKLSHGDIIHIGRINLRFAYKDIQKIPKPKVTPQESP